MCEHPLVFFFFFFFFSLDDPHYLYIGNDDEDNIFLAVFAFGKLILSDNLLIGFSSYNGINSGFNI